MNFHDFDISFVFKQNEEKLAAYPKLLDKVSEDIKKIEKTFSDAGVKLEAWVSIDSGWVGRETHYPESEFQAGTFYVNEIGWSDDGTGRTRVMFRENVQEDYVMEHGEPARPLVNPTVTVRPLIETKLEIRMQSAEGLHRLVEAVFKQVPSPTHLF